MLKLQMVNHYLQIFSNLFICGHPFFNVFIKLYSFLAFYLLKQNANNEYNASNIKSSTGLPLPTSEYYVPKDTTQASNILFGNQDTC